MRLRVAALVALLVVTGVAATAQSDAHAQIAALETATVRGAPIARGEVAHSAPTDTLPNTHRAVTYTAHTADPLRAGETGFVPVTVRNLGETTWESAGDHPVRLSYHLYDANGALVAWDGLRTELPQDMAPGATQTVVMLFAAPRATGAYTVKPDLIRDGAAWFSSGEAPAGSFAVRVSADLDAGYGPTTTPAAIVPGGEVAVNVHLTNTGFLTWSASGDHPVRLAYHWIDGDGNPVVWDGPRGALAHDVAPGQQLEITAAVRAPEAEGVFTLAWDLVQDGVGWFSSHAVPAKRELVSVASDVTIYGKGWGHGIGLSQWGAQGWAEGVAGPRLTGEQIVANYFPSASLATQPASLPFRVLLSAPSTGCVGRTIWNVAHMSSTGGMRLVNDADPNVVYLDATPGQSVRFSVYGENTLIAVDEWSGRIVFAGDDNSLTLIPTQWWDPIAIAEKGLEYRGNLLVQVRDDANLRVVNYVGSDDYMKGALPGEMPADWEMEALRAQAIAARTYAAWRQSTAGDRTWDVRDDTADQCYGGHSFESPRTTAAVASTPALILTYAGKPIRALYSASDGGITESVGCLLEAQRVGDTWGCTDGWPYLQVVPDPAEALAYDKRGGMPHDAWSATFSAAQIRAEIIADYGIDIGAYVAMQFNMSPGGRPISVRVRGSYATVDLKGDRFLRNTLGLKSTLVRAFPF